MHDIKKYQEKKIYLKNQSNEFKICETKAQKNEYIWAQIVCIL